ncbi:CD1375 family protein [Levilactobacillus brevis]|uniref:CD1375 family protein n=1 Tax=Levilactobacillus brevis TaxID=1580 RepID=A0AB38X7U1_LEVBR|nr:CD1375 family protein [Levilactobacillus brevis]UVW18106.1 CD1375 family protein [Levilactobacillus brevis]WAD02113.1 CD1375 family protein [Levilactobacillus brevis]
MEFSALAQIYAQAIMDGTRSIEEVPAYLQDDVKNVLGSAKNSTSTDSSSTPVA